VVFLLDLDQFTISDIPPLTFAGLRYGFASLFHLPGLLKNKTPSGT
jgi:hypothetical protein